MAIDEVKTEGTHSTYPPEAPNHTSIFMVIFLIMAGLVVGEVYSIKQTDSVHDAVTAAQAKDRADMEDLLSTKVAAVENSSAQALEALKTDLDHTAERMGSTGKQLQHARALVTKLQKQQEDQANELKQEIATKADQQQVGALTEDVSATKTDLEQTKKAVSDTKTDLGMARSEFGTLIARNHDDLVQLRKMGERDYFEFTLPRNKQQTVAGVGLVLKKANVKWHRFNVNLVADDMTIQKKNRTINEPIFFAVKDSKNFYELVVNSVSQNQIKGYISTPKGANETASNATQGGQ
ncbi:MAG TPA: hypothetical protein VG028_05240 [Terriglobia bacterium]|nr:hypothetical protein [Terriglobia bacterium]